MSVCVCVCKYILHSNSNDSHVEQSHNTHLNFYKSLQNCLLIDQV